MYVTTLIPIVVYIHAYIGTFVGIYVCHEPVGIYVVTYVNT